MESGFVLLVNFTGAEFNITLQLTRWTFVLTVLQNVARTLSQGRKCNLYLHANMRCREIVLKTYYPAILDPYGTKRIKVSRLSIYLSQVWVFFSFPECPAVMDIAFMFDASGSIHTNDFSALKNVIQKVTSQFVITSTGNIFSCLTFSCMISDNWLK